MFCTDSMRVLTYVYWSIAILSSLSSLFLPFAQELSKYGKSREASSLRWTVPKRFFTHFYLIGLVWSFFLFYCMLYPVDVVHLFAERFFGGWLCAVDYDRDLLHLDILQLDPTLAYSLCLFTMHCLRRYVECRTVSIFSPSARVHVLGYLIGTTFYLAFPWTLVVHSNVYSSPEDARAPPTRVVFMLSRMLFVSGSVLQFQCHRQLASYRRDSSDGRYVLPSGGWFDVVLSPHYFFELVLYLGLLLVNAENPGVWMAFLFSMLTLTSAARASKRWYLRKFDQAVASRKAIFPFLL